jgi:hypothetical protein
MLGNALTKFLNLLNVNVITESRDVSDSMPLIMARLSIFARNANSEANPSFNDVTSKPYNKKMKTRPMVTSKIGELNIIICLFVPIYRISPVSKWL